MNVPQMPRKKRDDDTLVTAADIAERWSVSRDSVYRVPPHELPFLKLGRGTRRYRWADVLAFERRCRVGDQPNAV